MKLRKLEEREEERKEDKKYILNFFSGKKDDELVDPKWRRFDKPKKKIQQSLDLG